MKGQTNSFVLDNRLQRELRRNMTDAEKALWQRLRGKQMKGCKFRRQHPFGDFILDFVCLEAKLVVEVDGGQHNDSTRDFVRDQALTKAGFRVMRFWNNQILGELDAVAEAIWLALELHPHESHPHPHPSPPLEGEGACNGEAPLKGRELVTRSALEGEGACNEKRSLKGKELVTRSALEGEGACNGESLPSKGAIVLSLRGES